MTFTHMRMSLQDTALAIVTMVCCSGAVDSLSAQGQEQTSAQTRASNSKVTDAAKSAKITVQTGLVLVPTIVIRSNGERVPNLGRENFTILKNGRPQSITLFQHIQTSIEHISRPEVPPNTFTNTVQVAFQRLTIFVLDQLNSSLTEQTTARDQLFKFLNSSASNSTQEPLCLFALDGTGLSLVHDFTTDPSVLAQALAQLSQQGGPFSTLPRSFSLSVLGDGESTPIRL
jgi:VWFA-related protein